MADDMDLLLRRMLARLEQAEARLLTWGVVEGTFTAEEIRDHALAVLDESGAVAGPDELRDLLLNRGVLSETHPGRFRTRMAESIRLLAHLRQLFPDRPWRSAPPLVADFRFSLRPRRYPRRHLSPAAVLRDLQMDAP